MYMVNFPPANKKILFIGNAASVLDHKFGPLIDSGDFLVCRFNNFTTVGFEEYVGTRSDFLCRRSCDDVKLHPADQFTKIFNFITYGKWTAGMRVVARNLAGIYKDKLVNVNEVACARIGERVGVDQPHREWCSIGVLALAYFTDHFPENEFYLHGFDFLKNGGTHYFPKPPRDSCYHNSEKEEKFIRGLPVSVLTSRV